LESLSGGQGEYGEARPGYLWNVETDSYGHPGLTHVIVTVDWEGNTVRPVKLEAYLFDAKTAQK
jgi:hypothetical protein